MIYIVAGNLQQAYQCATKNRLHMDLWVYAHSAESLMATWKPGDILWKTGTYSWHTAWKAISAFATAEQIDIILKD